MLARAGATAGRRPWCAPNPDAAVLNGSVSTAQLGGGCDDNITGAAVGKPCKAAQDCQPACCACPGKAATNSVSVQYCKAGVCATDEEACCTFDNEDAGKAGNPLCQ